ncbi:tRNA-His guanylyltransferase [Serendipita sp. 411]|nr:tRNA-His guanylyltransferase [Serendipita sp. 411]
MANSKYAYVKNFELPDNVLPRTYMVVRLDGHSFHKFSMDHGFEKPNDEKALRLMDAAAIQVMQAYPEAMMAFGESDEFSFLLRKSCNLYNRRSSKISSTFASLFAATYTFKWKDFFPDTPMLYPPSFDGRVVAYPSSTEIIDYFSWRQADTHVNNLYNTCFWALILKGGLSTVDAHTRLKGTVSSQKNEMLFSKFNINYNTLPDRFRKGSILYRQNAVDSSLATAQELDGPDTGDSAQSSGNKPARARKAVVVAHCDIISRSFWDEHPEILSE